MIMVAVLAGSASISCTTAAERPGRTASDSVGGAFEDLLRSSVKDERLLPKLRNGKVKAVEQKAQKILEYIISDYRTRNLEHSLKIHYDIVVCITNDTNVTSDFGQFRLAHKPSATYFIAIGDGLVAAERAVVFITEEQKDGMHSTRTGVYWNSGSGNWTLLRSEGPNPKPLPTEMLQ